MSYDRTQINKIITQIKSELDYAEKRSAVIGKFLIPVWQQPKLTERFRTVTSLLARDLSDGLAVSAWSLLSDSDDENAVHFKMFIQMADQTPEKNIVDQAKWNLFLTDSEAFLYELPKITRIAQMMFEKKSSVIRTEQYQLPLNHIDKIFKAFEKMKEIVLIYEAAVTEPNPDDANAPAVAQEDPLTEEIEDFMEWCRLTNYEKKYESEKRSAKRKQKRLNAS